MAARKAAVMRRQLAAVDADHAGLPARRGELEDLLLAAPGQPTGLKPWPRPVIF